MVKVLMYQDKLLIGFTNTLFLMVTKSRTTKNIIFLITTNLFGSEALSLLLYENVEIAKLLQTKMKNKSIVNELNSVQE